VKDKFAVLGPGVDFGFEPGDHRLNGSFSPVLTATHHSYGSLCDFLTFSGPALEARPLPQPIFTQNGSNDVYSRKNVL